MHDTFQSRSFVVDARNRNAKLLWQAVAFALLLLAMPARAEDPQAPATPKVPVSETYQGVQLTDDYQWLENANDPKVKQWTQEQNRHTEASIPKPLQQSIASQLQTIYEKSSPSFSGLNIHGGAVFILRLTPPAQQPVLLKFPSVTNLTSPVTIVDPNTIDAGGTTAIDWYAASHDGKLVAVCLSKNGSEDGTLRFFDAATGKELGDSIPRVQYPTAGGSAAWNSNNTGVFYTRYPSQGERPDADLHFYQQVWFHKLGTPITQDAPELTNDLPRIAEIDLLSSEDGRRVLASVANGDGGDFAHYLRNTRGQWQQISRFESGVKSVVFGRDNRSLYLLSRQNAPHGKILHMTLDAPDLGSTHTIVNESEAVIEGVVPASTGLYVLDLVGGPSRIRYFGLNGEFRQDIPIAPVSSVGEMAVDDNGDLMYRNVSYTQPFAYFVFDPKTKSATRTPLFGTSPVNFDDIEVVREMVPSKDGTKVPLNIMRRKGTKLDGKNPTLLYGYGGYGVNLKPAFDPTRRVWFDYGGVMAIANLRGGGEFGEEWHKAGNLTRKQNVFDDFIACGEWLIQAKYTNPKKLAIEGASNGGLLMGAALTQRPDLFRAVLSRVGIYDMLRVELEPNGEFNVTEFGSVKNKEQFDALYAYSPYHHVTNGVAYPAVLLAAGENDGRVNASNSRKMAARLQAATSSGLPILLRVSASSGHGMGSSMRDRIAERADILAFLIAELDARKVE